MSVRESISRFTGAAEIVLLPKADKSLGELSFYKTICLLETMGKFERVIYNKLLAVVESRGHNVPVKTAWW